MKTCQHMIQYANIESEWALLARCVYTYEEIVIVTEDPQCNRMTVTAQDRQQKNNIQIGNEQNDKNTIYNADNYACTGLMCKSEKIKYVWWINNSVVCSMFNVKCSWDRHWCVIRDLIRSRILHRPVKQCDCVSAICCIMGCVVQWQWWDEIALDLLHAVANSQFMLVMPK